jgi:hypothetical protein
MEMKLHSFYIAALNVAVNNVSMQFLDITNSVKVHLGLLVMWTLVQIFIVTRIKFDENPSIGSQSDTCGQTYRQACFSQACKLVSKWYMVYRKEHGN